MFVPLRTLGVLLCLLAAARAAADDPVHVALLSYRVVNATTKPAANVTLCCTLPVTNRYQEVLEVRVYPEPLVEEVDKENQRTILAGFGDLPPGQSRALRVLAWVRFKPVEVSLTGGTKPAALADVVREGFLADEPVLVLDKVRPLVQPIIAGKARDIDKARAIYEHMAAHCQYDLDEHMNLPPDVLSGKPASCSELAAAYVAMCRAAGIPARFVSAFVNREGTRPSTDWRGHRWAEFYAEGVGWLPVDPTNKLNISAENFFGRQQAKYLTLLDDGQSAGKLPDPGWRTLLVYREPGNLELGEMRTAAWRLSADRREEGLTFDAAMKIMSSADPAERLKGVGEWQKSRSALRMGLLIEACYDAHANVRMAAAEALGELQEPTAMLPLMDLLKTEADAAVRSAMMASARRFLKVADERQRALAVEEVGRSRSKEGLGLIEGMWDDPAKPVRLAVARTLIKFGDKPQVQQGYTRLVDDEDEFVAITAALRWSRLGGTQALRRLIGHLSSPNRWDRREALAALKQQVGEDFGYDPAARPENRRNREAVRQFQEWLDQRPETRPQ